MKNIPIPLFLFLAVSLAACGGRDDGASHDDRGHGDEAPAADAHAKDETAAHVELSAEQLRAAGIEVESAGPARLRELLPLYGVVAPNAERVREVTARFPGAIRSVRGTVGTDVRQGEMLATVESDESLQTYPIAAPLSGVITARNANPGEQSGSRALFTVADLSTVWVELSLFPRDLASVRIGQTVRVHSVDAGLSGEGRLIHIAPIGSNASQTVGARVLLDNPQRRWAPGLYVSAQVVLGEREVEVAVRDAALQALESETVVFVQVTQGRFEPRAVRVGASDGEYSEIVSGLRAGERYVAANSFVLKSQLGAGSADHGH